MSGQTPAGTPTAYGGTITPATIGYTVTFTTTYGGGDFPNVFEQIPSTWRPTWKSAAAAVMRHARRQRRAAERAAATQRIDL